jgi:hypothetical protein
MIHIAFLPESPEGSNSGLYLVALDDLLLHIPKRTPKMEKCVCTQFSHGDLFLPEFGT